MKYYKLDHAAYVKLIRRCAEITEGFASNGSCENLLELARVRFDYENLYFEVPEYLMQSIAVANMCEMAIMQYQDTHGEIDYADLGDFSYDILRSIIRLITN